MIAAIDIGGTKTLVAIFDDSMNIVQSVKFKTPTDYAEFLKELRTARLQLPLEDIRAGAIGTRGIVDRTHGMLVQDSVLPWHNVPLTRDCAEIFGCEFSIENDSKLAGLSEARAHTARNYSKVVYVTVSTGIGSTFVIKGQLDQNTINSEVGKWLVEKNNKLHIWEDVASGSWIKGTYGSLASDIDDLAVWKDISHNLALGFVNIAAAYTPDLIIIGGGVGTNFNKFGDILHQTMIELAHPMVTIPPIIEASYPEDAVIYGCYHSAHDRLTTS